MLQVLINLKKQIHEQDIEKKTLNNDSLFDTRKTGLKLNDLL